MNRRTARLYGAYVFSLMHKWDVHPLREAPWGLRIQLACWMALTLDISDSRCKAPWGLAVRRWPEAARIYLALCKVFGEEPEACEPWPEVLAEYQLHHGREYAR